MGCGKCGNGSRHNVNTGAGDLSKYAFLTPAQLKLRDQQEAAQKAAEEAEKEEV